MTREGLLPYFRASFSWEWYQIRLIQPVMWPWSNCLWWRFMLWLFDFLDPDRRYPNAVPYRILVTYHSIHPGPAPVDCYMPPDSGLAVFWHDHQWIPGTEELEEPDDDPDEDIDRRQIYHDVRVEVGSGFSTIEQRGTRCICTKVINGLGSSN
jgi:hypothetical protein